MFDTMVFTKIVGAFCGALLVFLLGQWVADELYTTSRPGQEQAYVIDVGDDAADADAEAAEEVSFEQQFASADPDAGASVWNQCRACHALEEGQHGVGPSMYDVVGREIAAIDGFSYSGALPEGEWTPAELSAFIENPSEYAPGTSMGYSGLADVEARANLIAYMLVESGGDLEEYAVEEAAAQDEAAAEEDDAAAREEDEVAAEADDAAAREEDVADDAAPEEEMGFAQLVASVDPAGGESLWNQCRACHALEDGDNRVGPHLHDLIDREVGSVEGFNYSGALSQVADVWSYENLSALIEDPRGYAPGTTMGYGGLADEEDRARLIAYIEAEGQ